MRFLWLFGIFSDPEHRALGIRQQYALAKRAHARHVSGKRLWGWTFVAVVVPIAVFYLAVAPLLIRVIPIPIRNGEEWLRFALIILFTWVWSAFAYGRFYIEPVRRAMREQGVTVCLHCGYQLTGQGRAGRCPECGAPDDRATSIAPAGEGSPPDVRSVPSDGPDSPP